MLCSPRAKKEKATLTQKTHEKLPSQLFLRDKDSLHLSVSIAPTEPPQVKLLFHAFLCVKQGNEACTCLLCFGEVHSKRLLTNGQSMNIPDPGSSLLPCNSRRNGRSCMDSTVSVCCESRACSRIYSTTGRAALTLHICLVRCRDLLGY